MNETIQIGAVASAVSANVALMVEGALSSMAWVKTKVIALIGVLVTSGALLGIYWLQLSSVQVDALDFTEQQTTKANAIMAAHRTEYLAIEKAHMTTLREEENLVKYEIADFPDELKRLNESFWREFDGICDDRQERVARRYMVLDNLFPFGEYPVNVEIAYDGNRYSVQQRRTQVPDRVESGEESPQLDPRWKRFWGDREDATANVLESVLGVVRGGRLMDPEVLTFEDDQPVLTADFVDTLNLGPDGLVRVNQKFAIGNDGEKLGYKYGIDGDIDGGWWGPNGTFSKTAKQLPDKYRRLLAE